MFSEPSADKFALLTVVTQPTIIQLLLEERDEGLTEHPLLCVSVLKQCCADAKHSTKERRGTKSADMVKARLLATSDVLNTVVLGPERLITREKVLSCRFMLYEMSTLRRLSELFSLLVL